jgi:glycosyltransferase involved in cell wall biosynthesis
MISVCLASFNGAPYIREQIASILSQLGPGDELIVSDDGSSDGTPDIIRGLNDERVRLLSGHERVGVVQNFERAILASVGEIIFLSDQDDVWLPGKVEACLATLKSNILVVTDCRVVDSDLRVTHDSFFVFRGSRPGILRNIFRNTYLGCCMAFRRELLGAALPLPARVPMHDMWLGLVAETVGRVAFISTPYLLFRRHGKNASPTYKEKNPFGVMAKLSYRLLLMRLLLARVLKNKIKGTA